MFDNQLEVKHIKIQLFLPQLFRSSPFISLRAAPLSLFSFFSDPLGHCFVDARSTQDFHLRRKKSTFEKKQRNCQTQYSLNFKEGNKTPVAPSVFAEQFTGIINRIEQRPVSRNQDSLD